MVGLLDGVRSILVAERARCRLDSGVEFAPGIEKSTWSTVRRGVAGTLIVEKIVGAAAEQGASLSQLKTLGEQVNRQTRSLGVTLRNLWDAPVHTAALRWGT